MEPEVAVSIFDPHMLFAEMTESSTLKPINRESRQYRTRTVLRAATVESGRYLSRLMHRTKPDFTTPFAGSQANVANQGQEQLCRRAAP